MPQQAAVVMKQGYYKFTDEEKLAIAAEITKEATIEENLEAEKKSAQAKFKSRIEDCQEKQRSLRYKFEAGGEYREYPCETIFNYATAEKLYTYNGEILGREPMTKADWQGKMDFDRAAERTRSTETYEDSTPAEPIHEEEWPIDQPDDKDTDDTESDIDTDEGDDITAKAA